MGEQEFKTLCENAKNKSLSKKQLRKKSSADFLPELFFSCFCMSPADPKILFLHVSGGSKGPVLHVSGEFKGPLLQP